jgi:DNA segregation ATPase FtsK/SpoIIIE, S-DNA-T family
MIVQLIRLIWRVLWFALTYPAVDAVAALIVVTWLGLSWPGLAGLAVVAVTSLAGLRVIEPGMVRPVRSGARAGLAAVVVLPAPVEGRDDTGRARPDYRGQPMLPVLYRVHRTGAVDLVRVGLVTGQAPADFEARSENLAHAFGARLCRIRGAGPGVLVPELVRADTLVDPIPAPPVTGEVDLTGLPVGRCEDGSPWRPRLAATHVLIAGATGSGKGSVIWSLIRALLPAIAAGWVQVWALDPKRMELSFGRALSHRYACQAAMVELLETAVAEMHARAGQFGGRTRNFTRSTVFPFLVILVDELARCRPVHTGRLEGACRDARPGAQGPRAGLPRRRVEPRLGSRVRGGAAARQTVGDISAEGPAAVPYHRAAGGSQATSIRWPSGSRHLNAT